MPRRNQRIAAGPERAATRPTLRPAPAGGVMRPGPRAEEVASAGMPRGGDAAPVRVAVCVATYRRPRMLSALLGSLEALEFDRDDRPDLRILVVDNDADGSSLPVVERARGGTRWTIGYDVEPVRNISLARNRGVERALAEPTDFIAFVDDDEIVAPDWLAELLSVQRGFLADAVFGPVVPRYAEGVARWVAEGGFFSSRRLPTGYAMIEGHTNNALVASRLFTDDGHLFDPDFGSSGGGDTHFFLRAHLAGARLVWADGAVVEELVPVTRARAGWILRRSFRIGHAWVACRRSLLPAYRWLLPSFAAALVRIGVGLLLVPVALPGGRAAVVRALRKVTHGAGALAAIAGVAHHEYTTVHGG